MEIFEFDNSAYQLNSVSKIGTEEKFYCMSWSLDGDFIAGGMDNGLLSVWKFSDLLKFWINEFFNGWSNGTETVHTTTMHEGAVKGLDFNIQQPNLLVSGGGKGKVFYFLKFMERFMSGI